MAGICLLGEIREIVGSEEGEDFLSGSFPESWDSKTWSWAPWDSERRITVLARVRNNLCQCWKYGTINVEISTAPLVEDETPLLNTYMSKREQEYWSYVLTKPEAKNDCAGEDHQQFNLPTDWDTIIFCRYIISCLQGHLLRCSSRYCHVYEWL
jgi:hypothetical protein